MDLLKLRIIEWLLITSITRAAIKRELLKPIFLLDQIGAEAISMIQSNTLQV
jgi:hypothetical protein